MEKAKKNPPEKQGKSEKKSEDKKEIFVFSPKSGKSEKISK